MDDASIERLYSTDRDVELETRVQRVVADRVGVDADVLVPDLVLADELALDSLDLTELVLDLEASFRIRIPDRQVRKLRTYGDLVRAVRVFVAQRAQTGEPAAEPPPLVRLEVRGREGQVVFARSTQLSGYALETLLEDVRQVARSMPVEVVVLDDANGTAVASLRRAFEPRRAAGVVVRVRTAVEPGPHASDRTRARRSEAILQKADWPRLAMVLLSSAGELLDALQRERLFTAAQLGSTGGRFERDLEQHQRRTDEVQASVRGLLGAARGALIESVDGAWDSALARLTRLDMLRERVVRRQVARAQVLEGYGQACSALLDCAAVVPPSLTDPVLARSATALQSWLWAKEQLGTERSELVGAFVGGSASESDASALSWLTDSLRALDGMKVIEDGQTAVSLERASRVVSVEGTTVGLPH